VKFAKYIPVVKENDNIFQLAMQIVDVTKWIEPADEKETDEDMEAHKKDDFRPDLLKPDSKTSASVMESSLESNQKNFSNNHHKESDS
jgi:hypothetical protein